jgi:hypothetical protein
MARVSKAPEPTDAERFAEMAMEIEASDDPDDLT